MKKLLMLIFIICLLMWVSEFLSTGRLVVFLDEHPHNVVSPKIFYFLGNLNFIFRDYPDSIIFFKRIVDRYPKAKCCIDASYFLGRGYEELGLFNEAKVIYDDMLVKYPNNKYKNSILKKMQLIFR